MYGPLRFIRIIAHGFRGTMENWACIFPNFEINQYHEIKIILESLELPFISRKMLRSLEESLEKFWRQIEG
jgi:hypothetical protein